MTSAAQPARSFATASIIHGTRNMISAIRRSALLASAAALALAFNALPASAQADAGTFALIAKITIKPGQEKRFVEAMQAQVDASRAEPGVVEFRILVSSSDPLVFYSFESYQDKAAFEAHVKTPSTTSLLAVLKEVQAKDLEAQFLTPLP